MATHHTFNVEVENVGASSHTFSIGDRTFTRMAEVPLGALLAITAADSETQNLRRAQMLADFVASWLIEEDRDDWRKVVLTFSKLSMFDEIVMKLVESLSVESPAAVPTSAHSSLPESAPNAGTSTPAGGAGNTTRRSPKSKRGAP